MWRKDWHEIWDKGKSRRKEKAECPEIRKKSTNGNTGRKLLVLFEGETSSQTKKQRKKYGASWSRRMSVSRGIVLARTLMPFSHPDCCWYKVCSFHHLAFLCKKADHAPASYKSHLPDWQATIRPFQEGTVFIWNSNWIGLWNDHMYRMTVWERIYFCYKQSNVSFDLSSALQKDLWLSREMRISNKRTLKQSHGWRERIFTVCLCKEQGLCSFVLLSNAKQCVRGISRALGHILLYFAICFFQSVLLCVPNHHDYCWS